MSQLLVVTVYRKWGVTMIDLKLEDNATMSLRELVYRSLREAILRGELKPGTRLMEMQLASQLGVSRTPIREAISRLDEEGLAEIIPRKGAHVSNLTMEDVDDIFELREMLEALTITKLCREITTEGIARLRYAQLVYEKAASTDDHEAIIEKDVAFHIALYEETGNKRLGGFIQQLNDLLERIRWESFQYIDKNDMYQEHIEIINAIEKRDLVAAKEAMRLHLVTSKEAAIAIIERGNGHGRRNK